VSRDTTYKLYLEYYSNEHSSGGEVQLQSEVAEGNADIDRKYQNLAENLNTTILNTGDSLSSQLMGEIYMVGNVNYRFKLSMDDSGKSAYARIKGLRLEIID